MVGPPGCGKTTWLGERVDDVVDYGRRPPPWSGTSPAASEISARKLPISFDCLGMLHRHCYHALGQDDFDQPETPPAEALITMAGTQTPGRTHPSQWPQLREMPSPRRNQSGQNRGN